VDVCVGGEEDYKKVGKVNTDMAAYKWDFTYFMTKEELEKYKGEKPQKLIPPKCFDSTNAERVIITKEELKQREMEIEQEKFTHV
jgi:hypothetical protein